jgi:hypothetical protein
MKPQTLKLNCSDETLDDFRYESTFEKRNLVREVLRFYGCTHYERIEEVSPLVRATLYEFSPFAACAGEVQESGTLFALARFQMLRAKTVLGNGANVTED